MNRQQQEFIESIAPKAQEIQRKYGVPASIAIAQAALESGWGRKAAGNNLFGIKADRSWMGAKIDVATHEYINGVRTGVTDGFRSYASAEDSIENYGRFLAKNGRYAGVVNAGSANEAADALQRAGYATDPKYSEMLKKIIRDNDLTRFDDASYRGYTDDGRFDEERRRLSNERQRDPATWDDFMTGFFKLIIAAAASAAANVIDPKATASVTPPRVAPTTTPAPQRSV